LVGGRYPPSSSQRLTGMNLAEMLLGWSWTLILI